MKTVDPGKEEKKTPPDMDTVKREFPADQLSEEFIQEKADWSEDISEVKKKSANNSKSK